MDSKDGQILNYLLRNGRDKVSDISRELNIPRITVHERIERMKQNNIIKGFSAIPNYSLLGYDVTAFILASFDPKAGVSQRKLALSISKLDGISEVHIIAGEWDMLIKARVKSTRDLGKIVLEKLREMDGIARTATLNVFESIEDYGVLL
ncbi:MAG: Lrp/AsnC family transcriptional regulator [Thermoplasmataceae archaeon]